MAKRGRKKIRIGVVGSAGTGKSTLVNDISKRLELPLVTSKTVVADILKKDCYNFTSGVQVERFLAQGKRQEKIMSYLMHEEKKRKNFVTDRPAIDLVSYSVVERYQSDPNSVRKMFERCRKHAQNQYTHLIVCPWVNKPITNNNLRTLNPWYQLIVHSINIGLLLDWKLPYYVVKSEDNNERIEEVVKYVSA